MYLTHDILVKYEACPEGIAFLDKHFPNGAELVDIMKLKHIPISFLHWGKLHLTTNEEERALYNQLVHIENSTDVFESERITNSSLVQYSTNVTDSSMVYHGLDISNSESISYSKDIKNSKRVGNSNHIFDSKDIIDSCNVKKASNVGKGSFVIGSDNIFNSNIVTNSNIVYNSEDITDSIFISHSKRLKHCLFCDNLTDATYCIFNKQINETQFDFVYEELVSFGLKLNNMTSDWTDAWNTKKEIIYDIRKHFVPINEDENLLNWIKTLPNYSPEILYNITYNERIF